MLLSLQTGCFAGRRGPHIYQRLTESQLGGWGGGGGAGEPQTRKPTSMTSVKPLHLRRLKPFFASKHLKIEVLRGAKPKIPATKKTGGFHLVKKPLLKPRSLFQRRRTVSIEKKERCCQQRRYCLSDNVDLASPSNRKGFMLPPPSAHHSHFPASKHVGSSFYIFITSDANVCPSCHAFLFSSPIAPGCLFQVLLRTGY